MDENTKTFQIKIADIIIEIECYYNHMMSFCKDYIVSSNNNDFAVNTSMEEIVACRKEVPQSEREWPGIAFRYADEYSEPNIIYKKIAEKVVSYNTILMHGATIVTEGQAYMLTAPSGVGKSTRIKIWKDVYPNSFVINGDKPLIKITDSEVLACGTPWCGNEGWNRLKRFLFWNERNKMKRIASRKLV